MIVLTLGSSLQVDGTVFGDPGQSHQRTSVGFSVWLLMPSSGVSPPPLKLFTTFDPFLSSELRIAALLNTFNCGLVARALVHMTCEDTRPRYTPEMKTNHEPSLRN